MPGVNKSYDLSQQDGPFMKGTNFIKNTTTDSLRLFKMPFNYLLELRIF